MEKITKKKIEKLAKIYDEIDDLDRQSTDAINAAKEFKNNLLLIKRKNGKEVEVTEGTLWEEVRWIGEASEGYGALKGRYPRAFYLGELQRAKAKELAVFCKAEIGLDPIKLRLIDIIRLIEAMTGK